MSNLKLVSSNPERPTVIKSKGFVLQHQSIDDQTWSEDPHCMLVAQYIIRKATYSPHTRLYGKHSVDLQIGQFVTSYLNLAKLSTVYALYKTSKNPDASAKSAIGRVLNTLTEDGFLSKVVLGEGKHQCSVITLKNWGKFQSNNVSFLKTKDETQEKTQETQLQQGVEGVSKTNNETLSESNTNKVLKQQERIVSKDTCQNSGEFSPAEVQKIPYQEIVELFATCLPALPQPKKLTDARRKAIKARHTNDLKSKVENWERYFNYIRENCSWMISGEYNINFDYVIKQSNFQNILEGAKNDRG